MALGSFDISVCGPQTGKSGLGYGDMTVLKSIVEDIQHKPTLRVDKVHTAKLYIIIIIINTNSSDPLYKNLGC